MRIKCHRVVSSISICTYLFLFTYQFFCAFNVELLFLHLKHFKCTIPHFCSINKLSLYDVILPSILKLASGVGGYFISFYQISTFISTSFAKIQLSLKEPLANKSSTSFTLNFNTAEAVFLLDLQHFFFLFLHLFVNFLGAYLIKPFWDRQKLIGCNNCELF